MTDARAPTRRAAKANPEEYEPRLAVEKVALETAERRTN